MRFVFLWTISANNAAVRSKFVPGDVCFGDEKTGVGAFDAANSLEEATELVGKAALPNGFVSFRLDQMSIFQDVTGDVVNDRTNEVDGGMCARGGRVDEVDVRGTMLSTGLGWSGKVPWRRHVVFDDSRSSSGGIGNRRELVGWVGHAQVLVLVRILHVDGLIVKVSARYRSDVMGVGRGIDGHRSRRFFAKEELAKGEDSLEFVWRGFLHARESVGEMFGGSDDPVGGCDSGDWHGVMLVPESVGETFGPGISHDEADAAIMLE